MPSNRARRSGVRSRVAAVVQHVPGADRVAADPVGGVVDRDRAGRARSARPCSSMYAAKPGLARSPWREEMFTIDPWPAACMWRDRGAAQPHRRGEVHPEDGLPRLGGDRPDRAVGAGAGRDRVVHEHGEPAEALDDGVDQARDTAASVERSAGRKAAVPPAVVMPSTTAAPRSGSRPVTATAAPSRAKTAAIARPMPDVEPVTSAISPCSRTRRDRTRRSRQAPGAGRRPDQATGSLCHPPGTPLQPRRAR